MIKGNLNQISNIFAVIIHRIIDAFPSTQQAQARVQLATVLHSVESQQLVPNLEGEQIPVYEIMHSNSAIRSMIRDNKSHQIDNAIASGGSEGMISMDQALLALYRQGKISKETALGFAARPELLQRSLN